MACSEYSRSNFSQFSTDGLRMSDSANDRLHLFNCLAALPPSQFDQVVFVLKVDKSLILPASAKPGDRVAPLLQWAEGPTGCGLAKVEQVLEHVLATVPTNSEQFADASKVSRRDVRIEDGVNHSAVVSGDRNQIEIHHHYGLPATHPEPARTNANEKILLNAVWTEVDDRLRQSLHNAIMKESLECGMRSLECGRLGRSKQ